MVSSLKSSKTLLMSLLALVLVVALACSSDDEPETVVDTPAAPTGPTAAEIAAAVAATIPEGVSATEIGSMIDSAISAKPGVTAAELSAAIKASQGDDLTTAEVAAIVKSALDALPAPQVDTSAIAGLVESAVMSAIPDIPEGVDAAEISALVAAAVADATSGISTSGDVSAAIAAALASQENLSADQVAAIVDASLESLRAAVAAQGEAIASLELAALPELEEVAGTEFSKVILPELERPTNIPADLVLADVQELNFLYQSGAKEGVTPPYVEGGGDRSMYPWIFMPPFQMASIEKNFALRQGFATGYSISDDGLTYLLHINPDAIFQDGTPITAQSIKDAWEYAAWPENQVGWGAILLHTRAIEGMEAIESGDTLTTSGLNAIDDVTLEIKMVKFTPTWPLQMAVWMLGAFKADQAKNDPEGFRLNPIGAGPYRATYFDDTAKQEYTATSQYWGQAAFIKKVHRPTVTDLQTGYIMYENGEIDVLYADSVRQPAIWQPDNPRRPGTERWQGPVVHRLRDRP